MTKDEAIELMKQGKKLTHKYFDSDEWIKSNQDGTIIFFEDGKEFESSEFWKWRRKDYFQTDWELYTN